MPRQEFEGHAYWVTGGHKVSVIYSKDMTMFAPLDTTSLASLRVTSQNLGYEDRRACRQSQSTNDSVNHLAWTTGRKTLISGSDDDSIRTWRIITWMQIAVREGHTNIVYDIVIAASSQAHR